MTSSSSCFTSESASPAAPAHVAPVSQSGGVTCRLPAAQGPGARAPRGRLLCVPPFVPGLLSHPGTERLRASRGCKAPGWKPRASGPPLPRPARCPPHQGVRVLSDRLPHRKGLRHSRKQGTPTWVLNVSSMSALSVLHLSASWRDCTASCIRDFTWSMSTST